jgi:hypothetical protein
MLLSGLEEDAMTRTERVNRTRRWAGLPDRFNEPIRFALAACVFAFFAGLDKAFFDGYLGPMFGVDWLRQAYNVFIMLSFALLGLTIGRAVMIPVALNLCLIPFNTINPFVTRVGFAFWFGCAGDVPSFRLIRRSAAFGTILGAAAVIVDGLYVTFIHASKTFGAGFFLNPNFIIPAVLGIPFLSETGFPRTWATLIVLASIFSGSDSAMLICLVWVALVFRLEAPRIVIAGVLVAVTFGLVFRTPLNYTYKTPHRAVIAFNLADNAARALLTRREGEKASTPQQNEAGGVQKEASRAVREMVMQDRTFGFKVFGVHRWRLLAPLSNVRANDVGHIGLELYAATYGIVLLIVYLVSAYCVLPKPVFLLFCLLLPLYTDPLFDFGVGLLALRGAPFLSAGGDRTSPIVNRKLGADSARAHEHVAVPA